MNIANEKTECPPNDVWQQLLNDQLSLDRLDPINDHLDQCAKCRAALAQEADRESLLDRKSVV